MKLILFIFLLLVLLTAQADAEGQEDVEDYPQEEMPQEEPVDSSEEYPNEMSDEPAEE